MINSIFFQDEFMNCNVKDILKSIESTTYGDLFLFQMNSNVYRDGDFRNLSCVKENLTDGKNTEERENR